MRCPECATRMQTQRQSSGVCWSCGQCGGQAAAPGWLRSSFSRNFLRDFWAQARTAPAGPRLCPGCGQEMRVLPPSPGERFDVDACARCRVVWFDPGELEAMPTQAPSSPAQLTPVPTVQPPASKPEGTMSLREALAVVGFPTEQHVQEVQRRPVITWGLAALLLVLLLVPHDLRAHLAFSPDAPMRLGGGTFVTSLLYQRDLLVALFTLWLLLIVGDNVEDLLGPLPFVGLVLLSTVGANVCWLALGGPAPMCGAVPAVWAMATVYLCSWPRVRLGFNLFGSWLSLPLAGLLGVVLALLLMTTAQQWIGEAAYTNLNPSAVQVATRQLSAVQTLTVIPVLTGMAVGGLVWLLSSVRR